MGELNCFVLEINEGFNFSTKFSSPDNVAFVYTRFNFFSGKYGHVLLVKP